MRLILITLLALLPVRLAWAGDVTVAVASNFLTAAEAVVEAFEEESGHQVTLTHGSTGQIFAQVVSGAPFDVFLAADQKRPRELRLQGIASARRTYAIGELVLVSRDRIDVDLAAEAFAGERVALADPMVAPYGLAATSSMESLDLNTADFQPLLVSNVGQVATLFVTGNADLAFVAQSLLPLIDAPFVTSMEGRHPPIRQDAVLMARADGNEAAEAFWAYLFQDRARAIITANGYSLPE